MLERKGLINRLIAAIIDGVLCSVVAGIAHFAGMIGIVLAAAVYAAFPIMEIMLGATPGKMIMKMHVTSEDGSVPTPSQRQTRALIRWSPSIVTAGITLLGFIPILGAIIGFLAGIVVVIGYVILIIMSWNSMQRTKQAFWDVKARTAIMGQQGFGVAEGPVGSPLGFPVQPAGAVPPGPPPQGMPPQSVPPTPVAPPVPLADVPPQA